MPLPKLSLPNYELKLPSNGQTVTIRPFLVKDEKLLLMALESEDNQEIISTTKQIIQDCLVGNEKIDVSKLPFFDVDYLFIALRAKSVGESINIKYTCHHDTCGNNFDAAIDISNCRVIRMDMSNEPIKPIITLGQNIAIKMKYPSYAAMRTINEQDNAIDKNIALICESVEFIQEGEKITTLKDITRPELHTFIEGLTQQQYKKLVEWIEHFPSFVVWTDVTCDKCGFEHHLEYKEFESFFV